MMASISISSCVCMRTCMHNPELGGLLILCCYYVVCVWCAGVRVEMSVWFGIQGVTHRSW